ncbi:MAG: hypothetical protein B6U94_02515 [Thermofilum sp. ex4484_79]|nr:MAG: hypothetical protein B6U94_02515 [Thermofilum sp. ex4484_79]
MRRIFIVVVKGVEEFRKYLPIFSRCVSSALMISHGLRRDASLIFFFLNEKIGVKILGLYLKQVRPDEQSLIGIMRKIIRFVVLRKDKRRLHAGIFASRGELYDFLKIGSKPYTLVETRDGTDIREIKFNGYNTIVYVVSLNTPLDTVFKNFEKRIKFQRVRVSRQALFPDNLIVLMNNELDRRFL